MKKAVVLDQQDNPLAGVPNASGSLMSTIKIKPLGDSARGVDLETGEIDGETGPRDAIG